MSNDLVISPEEFYFKAPYTSNSEIDLHLVNHSAEHYVAFKVKTIDPKRYVVKPTHGIIAPGKEFTVKVALQALANQDALVSLAKSKQKFMVQYRSVMGTPDRSDTAAILMAKSEGGLVIDKKINCRFDVDAEGAFKTTNEQSQGSVGGGGSGTPSGANAAGQTGADDAVTAFKSSTDASSSCRCPVSRCLRIWIIATLVVLFLAIAIVYLKWGEKVKSLVHKVDVSGVISGVIGRRGHN